VHHIFDWKVEIILSPVTFGSQSVTLTLKISVTDR